MKLNIDNIKEEKLINIADIDGLCYDSKKLLTKYLVEGNSLPRETLFSFTKGVKFLELDIFVKSELETLVRLLSDYGISRIEF